MKGITAKQSESRKFHRSLAEYKTALEQGVGIVAAGLKVRRMTRSQKDRALVNRVFRNTVRTPNP